MRYFPTAAPHVTIPILQFRFPLITDGFKCRVLAVWFWTNYVTPSEILLSCQYKKIIILAWKPITKLRENVYEVLQDALSKKVVNIQSVQTPKSHVLCPRSWGLQEQVGLEYVTEKTEEAQLPAEQFLIRWCCLWCSNYCLLEVPSSQPFYPVPDLTF